MSSKHKDDSEKVKGSQPQPTAMEEYNACLATLGEAESQAINELLLIRNYKKGDFLVREGEVSTSCYFVLTGCVRQYYLIDGEEKTTFFYSEGQSIFSMGGASKRLPAKHYLSFVEDSTLTVLTYDAQLELFKRFPKFERLSRISVEEELGNYQDMLATYITTTPEERYSNLLKLRPDLLNRVPQYQLASYLGIKPESLSRIRKRILQK